MVNENKSGNRRGSVFLAAIILILVAILAYGFYSSRTQTGFFSRNQNRPASTDKSSNREWATPIPMEGVGNFHKVSDTLYRGEQPTAQGMKALEQFGIKTVVNLRTFHSDRNELAGTRLQGVSVPMVAWHAEDEDIVRFLQIANDPNQTPVFVHCQHGSDRTGTLCAIYRMYNQGWTREQAIKEMTEGGFGFHEVWENLIRYLDDLDLQKIRQQVKAKQS